MENISIEGGGVSAFPVNMAQDGRNSTDNELDIICLIQERDAYKLETDKLRKIIDRQRFIIQSLQEQIARKQGASPASTPVVEDPEMLPASSGYHGVSPNNPFSAAMSRADAPNNNVKIDPDSAANATSNSLGLSALSTTVQPKSSPAIRKISQGAATASPSLQPDNRDSVEVPSSQGNARPWAKSTRLSEIYADYSARHNSVSPMFKSSATSSTGLGGNDGDKTYRVPSSGGSSFVESLKSSIQRTEWPNELGSPGGLGYGSDNSPGGRRISSLVLDPSRDRSHSLETEGAQKLRSSSAWSTKSVADGPDGDFVHISNMPAETTKGTTPQITKQLSNVSARSVGNDAHYSSRDIADPSNAANPSKSAMAEPVDTLQSPVSAKSAAQTAQELVMRPISIFANRADSTLHSEKSVKEDEAQMQKDGNWRASQISQYEYGDLFDKQPVQVPTDVISSQQQLQQRQQQQQTNKASYANNSSFGPAADAEHKVKWAMDNGSSSKNAGPELVVSTTFSDATRPLPGTRLQGSKELQGIPEDEEVQSSAQNDAELLFKSPNSGSSVHYESSVTSMPQSITPSHSYASTSKYEAQPGATQLSSLQDIDIWIKDSRVKIDERGKEVNVYMVDIVRRKEISGMSLQEILIESQQSSIVLWTVEKRYSDFLNLNTKLRQVISKERISDKLEKLPDKDIFRPNAPTKSDKRKVWFEKYLKKALVLQILDKQPLIEFLSTDRTMEPEKKMPILLGHKEGFLVKKGKNFGGWKRRYYTCKSNKPLLEYFESPGGSVIGSINLSGAVVKMGKTRENEVPTSRSKGGQKGTDMFRHAFLIEEQPKRAGKDPISHPLWADSDRERDEWVMALRYVIVLDSDGPERAMRDVVKYLNYTNNKDPNMLMLHQIHTSITHEQGARRSIEYSRRKEEQRISSASVDSSDGRSFEMRRPSYAQPSGSSGNGNSNSGNSKFGSPLSRQMWPVAASMDNLGYTGRSAGKLEMKMLAEAEPKQKPTRPPGMPDPIQEQVDHRPSQERNRHRSISYPSSPVTESELPDSQRRDTGINKTRTSPTVIAATLSTSFSGCNDDSLSTQADRISVHYVPSEISTIESSLYSSYNGAENSRRANGVSSRSVDEHTSYASLPESPVSPRKLAEAEPVPTGRAREKGASNHTTLQQEQKGKGHTLVHAESTPQLQIHGSTAANPSAFGDAGLQMAQAVAGMSRSQFTKNSLGRIVHEEDYAPELPSNTPRVTDDILGVGRQESPSPNSAARNASNGEGHTRTREEKKRGRITFMWGKRKPVESEAPALPDNPIVGSSSNAPGKSAGGPGADSSPPVSVSRRLRRGSLHGDNRLASRSNALKAPIFGLPLERAVKLTKIKEHYHLPAVVYRCIEFLDAKKAWLEEGIYRQSGSSLALSTLRKEFNSNSDYNLLKLSKPPDIHAVASLLKAYLRELPESVLTLRLHQEFMRVVDLADRGDRVHELGRLVSELPIANYTLLRALTAHLIRIVQKASTNRMTLRNIGIVFSPSLGIPVSVFSLLMVEFEYIFWVNDSGIPEPKNLFAETSSTVAGSTSALRYQPDAHLSVSVSSGLNRVHDDDTLYSAESQTAADSVSFASDAPVHPSRVVDKKRSASSLRPGGHIRPVISNQRSQEGIRGAAAAAAAATVAAIPDEEWDPHMDDELLGSPGNNVGNDLSRYPGLPASTKGKQKQQQQQQRTGRSNRNSIQYNVGAPRELISQEADMTVPQIINESDDSDDSDVDSDDFSRDVIKPAAARNNSSLASQSISSRNASSSHR